MSARGLAAIGALGIATTLVASPDAAQSDSQGTTTPAASAPVTAVQAAKPAKARTGIRVRSARRNVGVGRRVVVRGTLRPSLAGKTVRLQLRRNGRWTTLDRARTGKAGAFSLRYTTKRIGSFRMRVLFRGDGTARAARRPIGTVNVYRKVFVSWYGGGGAVACPGASGRAALGVAHKTLPCGTKVTLRYHGRTVQAKVIDRGPYVGGREYDLTAATKNELGTGDLATIQATR
jgi:hypothetical protein